MNAFPKKSVVVPVDFSDESFAAVDVALEWVNDPAHVHVIHVLRDVTTGELEHIWDQIDEASWHGKAHQTLVARLAGPKYNNIGLEVVFGSPGESIAECARRVKAELIVMPSHGRRGASRLLLGSVAERVIRLAHCPVLVLKAANSGE